MKKNIFLAILAIIFHFLVMGTLAAQIHMATFMEFRRDPDVDTAKIILEREIIYGDTTKVGAATKDAPTDSTRYYVAVPVASQRAADSMAKAIDGSYVIVSRKSTPQVIPQPVPARISKSVPNTEEHGADMTPRLQPLVYSAPPQPRVVSSLPLPKETAVGMTTPKAVSTPPMTEHDRDMIEPLEVMARSFVKTERSYLLGKVCYGELLHMYEIPGVEYWKMSQGKFMRILDGTNSRDTSYQKVCFLNDHKYTDSQGYYYRVILMATPTEPKELPKGVAAIYYNGLWHCYISKLFKEADEADQEMAMYIRTYPELYAGSRAFRQRGIYCGPK